MPFLENVTRGRNIPLDRLLEVAEHYQHFGGRSPINDQNRALIAALRDELAQHNINLPIYWGNRNWHPYIAEALQQMRSDGVRNALAFVTSAYSSYSGCRQYREKVAAAQAEVGEGAPEVHTLRAFYNHPGFIQACADGVRQALRQFSSAERPRLVATAHSIPSAVAATSAYERQLGETARLVAEEVGISEWDLVYQSRSGPPSQPWLGPDILDHLRTLHERGTREVILAPVGFISDHMEVLYDLDSEARELAESLGMKLKRASTAGTHPAFIRMIRQLIEERLDPHAPRLSLGSLGPNHDVCPADCCPPPRAGGRPLASATTTVLLQP
jgi:ferrochelatase